MKRQTALKIVLEAVQELNEELEYESLENPTEDTVIFGGADGIDSLSLVSLVVSVEAGVEEAFGTRVPLADEKAMSQRNSPYQNVGRLADFIMTRLDEAVVEQ